MKVKGIIERRIWGIIGGTLVVLSLLLLIIGCSNRETELIKTAEDLYRQSVNHRKSGETEKAIEKLQKALDEYQKILNNFPNRSFFIDSALYQIWDENYKLPDYEAASLILQKLAKNFPKGVGSLTAINSLFLIALKSVESENYEDARRAYQELVDNFPSSDLVDMGMAWHGLGDSNYQLKNYKAAREAFKEFLKRFPDFNVVRSNEARLLIAHSYLKEREYNQAYLAFDTLTSTEFEGFSQLQEAAMFYAAYSLKNINVYDEALGRYTEFLTQFPNSKYVSETYFDRGWIYANKKDYELARSNYNRALKRAGNPNHKARIQLEIGHTHYNQGDFEKARTAYNLLLQKYPESKQIASARRLIARTYRNEEEWDKAIDAYNSIIKNHAKVDDSIKLSMDGYPISVNLIASIYYGIGYAFDKKKDFKAAFKSYARIVTKPEGDEKDLRVDPIAPFALYNAMATLNTLGDLENFGSEVQSELREILDVSSEEPLAIGEVLEQFAGKYISSLAEHHIILSAEAQFNFAEILRVELDQDDKALTEYAKLQNYPPIPNLRLDLIKLKGKYYEGFCYNELSRLKDADKAYQETITLFNTMFQPLINIPNIDVPTIDKGVFDYCLQTAQYHAGKSYFATKQFGKAIAEFEKFLKKANPESERAKEVRANVEEAHRKLETEDKAMEKSDASDNPNSLEKAKTEGQEIAQRARESTVLLILEYADGEEARPEGTGFFVRPDLIATNHHVIKAAIRGTARLVGHKKRSYAIIGYTAIDADRDLAILKVRAFGVKPLLLGNSENIKVNDDVYAVGNPLGRSYLEGTVSYGKISGLREDPSRKWIQITAPISPGNSGGPVLNSKGEVVGISTLISIDDKKVKYDLKDSEDRKVGYIELPRRNEQNLNFAVHVDELKALLKRVGPPKPLNDLEIIE